MFTFKLSLPTDIPWRRICVSQDMLDPLSCDDERPPRWRSSLAAFRYDPAEEYQPYENEVVSYIKVVATIAPYQPEIDLGEFDDYLPLDPNIPVELEESFPTYGAILQVSVAPTSADKDNFFPRQYPYIIDCEPKKRELYEAVSDTNEILSGSSSSLIVGKAATNTNSVESYNLDMGGSVSQSAQAWGAGAAFTLENREQVGTVHRTTVEAANVRQSDMSTERRELHSHTTQLTQMYNLFQVFHLGTNRALFLMEPRPHIRQTEATFINGPRALEGVQEVFLVVVRPKAMEDFCVGALLETAHVTREPRKVQETATVKLEFRLEPRGYRHAGRPVVSGGLEKTETYHPPDGWVIDLSAGLGGYTYEILQEPPFANLKEGPTFTVDSHHLTVSGWMADTGIVPALFFYVDVTIYIKKVEQEVAEYVRKLFLSARELCCCPLVQLSPTPEAWIAMVVDLERLKWPIYSGLGSRKRFVESRQLAAAIRHEMIRSFSSSARHPRGKLQYADSDAFYTRVADLLRISRQSGRLQTSLSNVAEVDDATRGRLYRALGDLTVDDVLTKDSTVLARALDMDESEVRQLKRKLLREISRGDSGGGHGR